MSTYSFTFKFTDTAEGTLQSPESIDVIENELLRMYSHLEDFRDFKVNIIEQDGFKVIDGEYTVEAEENKTKGTIH